MKRDTVQRKVAGVTLQVPVYGGSEKATDELIRQVNERVAEIAESSHRIDTQAFAIQAALSFAAELRASQEERLREGENTLKALRKLAEVIRSLAQEFARL